MTVVEDGVLLPWLLLLSSHLEWVSCQLDDWGGNAVLSADVAVVFSLTAGRLWYPLSYLPVSLLVTDRG